MTVTDVPSLGTVADLGGNYLTPEEDTRRRELFEAAVGYAKRGFRVIPVRWVDENGRCSCHRGAECPKSGKHPVHDKWPDVATSDPEVVASWWREPPEGIATEWWPHANIGIATGEESGVFVLDDDPYSGGDETLAALERRHGPLPETRVHHTGSGGVHYFFRHPGFTVHNSAGKRMGKGLDIRGDGGQVVAPPSVSAKGIYELNPVHDIRPAEAPAWLLDMLRGGRTAAAATSGYALAADLPKMRRYTESAVRNEAASVRDAPAGERNDTLNRAAFILGTLGEYLAEDEAWNALHDAATAAGLGAGETYATFRSGWSKGMDNPRQVELRRTAVDTGTAGGDGQERRLCDVTNPAMAGEWLRLEMGRNALSGLFIKDGGLVHTPMVGEDGYIEPTPAEKERRIDHGPAQVRAVSDKLVKAKVTVSYDVVTQAEDTDSGKTLRTRAFFPGEAAQDSVNAALLGVGCPNLEVLKGVTHTPVMRRDGSVLDTPGYDRETGLLYLPDRGLAVPPVPEAPTAEQVKAAVELLLEPVGEFPFVKDHHRANWLGMMLTPLLREMLPGPYQLGVISAPNSGSGKGYLAGLIRIVHGMVMRGEMPREREEMRKVLISVLSTTTAPVALFDNVRGEVYSSELEALLTSEQLQDRVLGQSRMVTVTNDRLWLMTGNNARLSGDMTRRVLEVHIDPKCSDPAARTFAITDLMGWMEQHRSEYIAALLTVARGWVLAGAPSETDRSDNFATWRGSLRGLLHWAGVPGTFGYTDDTDTAAVSDDAVEWHAFLEALREAFGSERFGSKDVVAALRDPERGIARGSAGNPRIDPDSLAGSLAEAWEQACRTCAYNSFARSVGKWMGNRDGRFTMGLAVRAIHLPGSKKSAAFVVETEE